MFLCYIYKPKHNLTVYMALAITILVLVGRAFIRDVSWGIINILGGGSMDYSK